MGRESLTQSSGWALFKCHTGVYVEFPGGRTLCPVPIARNRLLGTRKFSSGMNYLGQSEGLGEAGLSAFVEKRERESFLWRLAVYSYSPLHASYRNVKKISTYKSVFFTHFHTVVMAESRLQYGNCL